MTGVELEGFVPKTYSEILEEKVAKAQQLFGDDVDLTQTSPLYMMLEVQALEEARLWEVAEAFYYSAYVDFATGQSLDRVVELIGVTRKSAAKASGTVTFTGVPGTAIPQDTVVQTAGDDPVQFETDVADVIGGGGTVDIAVTAVFPGAEGNLASNTLTVLEAAIAGVSSVTNADSTTGGTDIEEDDALRSRAKAALVALSKGTLEAIRQAVLAVSGVSGVAAVEDLDIHKVTLYVSGKTPPDSDVDDAIEDTRPAGIPVDWYGVTMKDIYVDVTVEVNDYVPVDAATQIKTAIVSYITALTAGDDVIWSKLIDMVYDSEEDEDEPWIEDITELKIGFSDPPTSNSNLTIDPDEEAQSENAKVDVTLENI